MALNEFQTQVLLLHSEQSTLDDLALGFNDRYTVHCATSGSEALTTLVETPINVIVSAQELPGMSGLEALREAKKRSPDTIGILLAGSDTSDLEALVGDEEVFQVVRGNVTGDGLQALVDNATQQMRLMALAESANDTAANVDQPVDHIVMETAKDGASLVTEQTGRLRAIKDAPGIATGPKRTAGPRTVDILVMTKDSEFFETIKDSARSAHQVHYANTLGKANDIIRNNNVGVAVIDAAMAGEKVEKLNQHLCTGANRLVSIVAGRRDDGEMLMDLINRGKVYRFLLKPVSPGRARLALEASVRHHLDSPQAGDKGQDKAPSTEPAASRRRTDAGPAGSEVAAAPKIATAKPAAAKPPATGPAEDIAGKDEKAGKAKAKKAEVPAEKTEKRAEEPAVKPTEKPIVAADKPVSPQPGEATVGGSMAESMENVFEASVAGLGYGSGSEGSPFKRLALIGLAVVAAIAVGAGAYWYFGNNVESDPALTAETESPVEPASEEAPQAEAADAQDVADPVVEEQATATAENDTNAVLQGARAARDAGQIVTPIGGSALDLFGAAMSADPDNSIIAAEFEAAVEDALALAEFAILESRLDEAATALDRVASVNPENARLPFLFTQLIQMQQKQELDQARIAIREGRYQDAAGLLANARLLDTGDTTDLDAVAADLNSAQSKQQIEDILANASARLDSGELLSPAGDSARYYFELALQNDPGNTAARQGLGAIASKLALKARNQIDNGDLEAAELTLASAWELDADNSDIAASNVALNAAKAAIVENQRLEAERIAAEAEARQAAEAEAQRLAEEARLAKEASDAAASQAVSDSDGTANQEPDVPASDDAAAAESIAAQSKDQGPAPDQATEKSTSAAAQAPTSISAMTRTKYVAPKYPRSAQRRNLSGWVDVVFTVSTEGTVIDVEVRNSEPGTTFVNAAVSAIEKWEFEPIIENGVPTEKRAGVRLMFALE